MLISLLTMRFVWEMLASASGQQVLARLGEVEEEQDQTVGQVAHVHCYTRLWQQLLLVRAIVVESERVGMVEQEQTDQERVDSQLESD